MDIKQILKEKINALFDERKPLVEEFEQYHTYVKYPDITKLNGEIQAYVDCANLIEQSEKPMKVGESRDCVNELDKKTYNQKMYLCPNCSRVVAPFLVTDYDKICFCPYCGQHLDWGEGEKK